MKRKPEEVINLIKRLRCSKGFFTQENMAEMFVDHGLPMTRQSYSNKETGKSKFNVDEIQVLADVFELTLKDAIHIFNDWD